MPIANARPGVGFWVCLVEAPPWCQIPPRSRAPALVPAGYLNPAGVPAAALETINAVIDRQSKTIDTLINLVEALTAKVDRLQNQIANQ